MPRYWPHGSLLCVTETASAAPASPGAPNRATVPASPARIRVLQLTTRLGAEMVSGQMCPMRSYCSAQGLESFAGNIYVVSEPSVHSAATLEGQLKNLGRKLYPEGNL